MTVVCESISEIADIIDIRGRRVVARQAGEYRAVWNPGSIGRNCLGGRGAADCGQKSEAGGDDAYR